MAHIAKRYTKAGSVRWDARVRIGSKVITKTHRTKALAEAWARRQEDSYRAGELVDPDLERRTVREYAKGWLLGRKLAPRTVELYEDLLERRIYPDLGDVELRSLTPEVVRQWWRRQPEQVYSAKAYRLLRAIAATAHRDGILRRNPVDIEGAGIEHSAERVPPTPKEITAAIAEARPRFRALVVVAAWCGLRSGEVLGLERQHVDLLHRLLHVEQAADWSGGKRRIVPPKSFAGRRVVALPQVAVDALEEHLTEWVGSDPTSPVAVGARGGPLTAPMLQKEWRRIRKKLGLAGVRFHDLRHAAGTMAAWTGATTKELQAFLGHSSAAASLRYQHAAEDRRQALAAGLDAIASGASAEGDDEVAADVISIRTRDRRAMEE